MKEAAARLSANGQRLVRAFGSDERILEVAITIYERHLLNSKITPVAVPRPILRSTQLLQPHIRSPPTHRDPNATSTHNGGRIRATKAQQQREAGAARRGCRWKGAMLR